MSTATNELFDTTDYKVPFPNIDGLDVEDLVLVFSGRLALNRNDPEHTKLMESLTLGRKVTMSVFGNVAAKQNGVKYDADANEHVTATVTIRIDHIDSRP